MSDKREELIDLVVAAQTGELTAQRAEVLRNLIENDAAALEDYVAIVSDSVALSRLLGDAGPAGRSPLPTPARADSLQGAADACVSGVVPHPGSRSAAEQAAEPRRVLGLSQRGSHLLVAVLSSAATLMLAASLFRGQASSGQSSWGETHDDRIARSRITSRPSQAPLRYVATLTGAVDCEWPDYLKAPHYGEPLVEGRVVDLESGIAQLTFDDGAKVIVQGPAHFTVDSAGSGKLNAGKLTAIVPRQAVGFRVKTPTAEVVDLGTEFGLDVAETGETEVHVFAGEVVFWDRHHDSQRDPDEGVHLFEDESAIVGDGGDPVRFTGAPNSKFVREITPRLARSELPALPVADGLALWLAADVLVKTDGAGRVVAWRDIVIGDNQTEEDAWQQQAACRPRYVRGAINGKPALRFDGESSYLVTTPLASTEAQTLHFVMTRAPLATAPGAMHQLINYNGPPYPLDKSEEIRVLQIDDSAHEGVLWARCFAGAEGDDPGALRIFNTGSVETSDPVPTDTPFVLSYRYDPDRGEAAIYVNGRVQGTSGAPHWKSYSSRKVLGRHPRKDTFFKGDLAEVLIYNDGLSDKQNAQVIAYLMQRYAIEAD